MGDWNGGLVFRRSVSGNGEDASRFAQRIKEDLRFSPLAPGEQLNIIALSGGATTAFNAARYLGKSVPVDHLITLGGVVFQGSKPSNVASWIKFIARADPVTLLAPVPDKVVVLPGSTTHDDYIGTPQERQRVIAIMLELGVR